MTARCLQRAYRRFVLCRLSSSVRPSHSQERSSSRGGSREVWRVGTVGVNSSVEWLRCQLRLYVRYWRFHQRRRQVRYF